MKNAQLLFAVGQGSLAIAWMINHYIAKNLVVYIIMGLFTILSMVANIILIGLKIKEIKSKRNK